MTKVINMSALTEEPKVTILIGETEHHMKAPSVKTFVENMKAIEGLGLNATILQEMEVMCEVILRAFPTLSRDLIDEFPLDALQNLSEIARGQGGEVASTDAAAIEDANVSGNPLKAN